MAACVEVEKRALRAFHNSFAKELKKSVFIFYLKLIFSAINVLVFSLNLVYSVTIPVRSLWEVRINRSCGAQLSQMNPNFHQIQDVKIMVISSCPLVKTFFLLLFKNLSIVVLQK